MEAPIEESTMRLAGNTVLITGGGTGIGRGLAEAFVAAGSEVIIAGRRESVLRELAMQHERMHYIGLDVADPLAIGAFGKRLQRQFPALNVLVNNAGIMRREDWTADGPSLADAEQTVNINLLGPLRVTRALLPLLRAQPRATIVNVTSGLAFVPLAQTPTYCATKAALHSFTDSLRYQLRDTAIECVEWAPPYTQTELLDGAHDPAAMPLQDFLRESLELLSQEPTPREICVERVRFLRDAEREHRAQATFVKLNEARAQAPQAP
jgi:uncharacterized oxidoreductase